MDIKRKLATIRRIKMIEPIEGADRIVKLAFEDMGWVCVTNVDTNPQVGDLRVYFEVDSMLPSTNPVFAFMESDHYRVRTRKFKGQISQGLSMPLAEFPELASRIDELELNADVTDILGVTKYELPESVMMSGDVKGPFPSFIFKTDEERAQNIGDIDHLLSEHEFDVTVKMDGTSSTFYLCNGEFGVCSRNLELKNTEGNLFWKMAQKYNIEARLRALVATGAMANIAIQGEVVGPGIQSNRAKLPSVMLCVFTIQDLDNAKRIDNAEIANILEKLNTLSEGEPLRMVPTVSNAPPLKTLSDIAALSEGSCIFTESTREGIVLRAKDNPSISFKYISAKYLLKHDL